MKHIGPFSDALFVDKHLDSDDINNENTISFLMGKNKLENRTRNFYCI